MGSPTDEAGRQPWENLHQVTITSGFWMLSTEVTQALYENLMGSNPSSTKGPTLPVEGVSVDEAEAFCAKLATLGFTGARLPTEREWEFACRAGGSGPFAAKPTPNEQGWMAPAELVQLWRTSAPDEAENAAIRWVAQHVGDGDLGIKPVGGLAPNRLGLFDLHGNVMEWCRDRWDGQSPYAEGATNTTNGDLNIVRGGCWFYPPERCRAASRQGLPGDSTLNFVGFRVVVPEKVVPDKGSKK
jgi:formylglycine-generating enzyme required for sulfatase activity